MEQTLGDVEEERISVCPRVFHPPNLLTAAFPGLNPRPQNPAIIGMVLTVRRKSSGRDVPGTLLNKGARCAARATAVGQTGAHSAAMSMSPFSDHHLHSTNVYQAFTM